MTTSKKIFIACFCIIILLLVSVFIIGRILTANISKEFIVKNLETITGYNVNISGPLHWHYTLRPSLSVDKIVFTAQNKTIIQLDEANIGIALLPLLQKHVAVDFHFQQWQQNQVHFSQGVAHLSYQNNILTLTDFDAAFYQGHIHGNAIIDLNGTAPLLKIKLNVSQTEIEGLLQDIANTPAISGKMDLHASLKSMGSDANSFIKNLNGEISILVKNGKLNTIHLGSVLPDLNSISAKKQADFFESLQIKNAIKNGIAETTIDLLAKSYKAQGNGQINLNNKNLNLKLNAYYTQARETKYIAVPIYIRGTIASPKLSVDLATPINQYLNKNKDKIVEKLHKFFD